MMRKIGYFTTLFVVSFVLVAPSWGQLVDKVDLVRPLPVPVQGSVEVEGNVNVVNTPEVIVREFPELSVTGDVNVVNSPEVRIADVTQVEVINEASKSVPVRIIPPPAAAGREDPRNFFSWHRHSFVNGRTKTRNHSAISRSKMGGRPFVLTDMIVTARFLTPDTQLTMGIHGAGADRGLGLDFILLPEAPHLVSHFQTGILFSPGVAINVSVSGAREGENFEIDYTATFSGYFLTEGLE
jgi:hypothetical protein